MITPGIDHIALTVPDLDAQFDRLARNFGMVVEHRFDGFALVTDPGTGLKLELGQSEDSQVHFRHFGFRTDNVDHTQPGGSRSNSSNTTSDLKRDAVSCMLAVIGDDRRGASHRDPDLSPWVTAPSGRVTPPCSAQVLTVQSPSGRHQAD
jgi:catechol 2,3-dioxygenase-like lactoylglutathione lyase family enzyme